MDYPSDGGKENAYEKMVEAALQTFLSFTYFPYFCSLHYPEETSLHAGWSENI